MVMKERPRVVGDRENCSRNFSNRDSIKIRLAMETKAAKRSENVSHIVGLHRLIEKQN